MRFKFIPREKAFFEQFSRAAANMVDCAQSLKAMLDNYSDPRSAHEHIVELEHSGDFITHEIVRSLNTTFITPMDREDIHALTSGMDDVVDFIEAASDIFILYNIPEPTATARAQAEVLLRACESVRAGVDHLESFKNLEQYWIEVNKIENEGDKIYRRAVADLFNGDYKAMEVLKWKEIYTQIEDAIDACEKVANVLESIVLKNA